MRSKRQSASWLITLIVFVSAAVFLFGGCSSPTEVQSDEPFIDGYFSCLQRGNDVEDAIKNAADDLERQAAESTAEYIPELEEKIFELINSRKKAGSPDKSGVKLCEAHTTQLYPSLSTRELDILESTRYGSISNGGTMWVKTAGLASRMKSFTAFGTLLFEITSDQIKDVIIVSFEVNYDNKKEQWKVLEFTHKVL